MSSYIPAEDHAALAWLNQFSAGVNASPYTYAMSPADAVAVAGAVAGFAAALAITDNDNTRNKATIITKDDARASAEQMCRKFAMLIKNNPGISDADKMFVGVRPINTSREPVHVPATSPILNIQAATPGSQTLWNAE